MNTQIALQQQAIDAAKRQDWAQAVELNSALLEHYPTDLGALNRLGVAQIQTGDIKAATKNFQKVLELDKSNSIAKKHLTKLKSNQLPSSPSFSSVYFIEEPGKTKITELHRLAGKQVLENLAVGQPGELIMKNRYVSVEIGKVYIGALPEDLSFRLSKLIKGGNEYACYIHSISPNSCTVYLKELVRSEANQFIHSFPPAKNNLAAINDIDETFLLDDDIPVEMGAETDIDDLGDSEGGKPYEVNDLPDNDSD